MGSRLQKPKNWSIPIRSNASEKIAELGTHSTAWEKADEIVIKNKNKPK